MKQKGAKYQILFSLFVSVFASCGLITEETTEVRIEGDNPPVFFISGSGTLANLVIYGPLQRDIGGDRAYAVWEIEPINGHFEGRLLEDLKTIKYGVIPNGYKQIYPENNAPPPPLTPGPKYEYWFQTINAPHARAYFKMHDGKAVVLDR